MLFTRGTSEWISRISQKHKHLIEPGLSAEQKERLDRWAEIDFVYSTLKLEGANIERDQVARVLSNASGATDVGENERATTDLLASLRMVTSLARANGKAAELTAELLQALHGSGAGFRRSAGDASRVPKPVAAEHLPALIESACRWYTAESFGELNPVEQASIVLLRLIDMQPFEQANERTALVAGSLFTLRGELPPIIIKPEMSSAYRNALDEGTRMNTKPMVETIAEAIERSVSEMLEQIGKQT